MRPSVLLFHYMEPNRFDSLLAGQGMKTASRAGIRLCGIMAVGSFLLVFHNYGLNIFPAKRIDFPTDQIRSFSTERTFAYVYAIDPDEPGDTSTNQRSRARLFENNSPLSPRVRIVAETRLVGGGRWTHEPGRIVFSTSDNTDPRQNGRTYVLYLPRFYSLVTGRLSVLIFVLSSLALCWLVRKRATPAGSSTVPPSRWRRHALGAVLLFSVGLYCNTGTLAPYAITSWPYVDKETGYLYNTDHTHFRALFYFVDGRDRGKWDHALLLRRILFPVLAWPLMKLAGFKAGGALAAMLFNVAGLAAGIYLLWRRIGERGAIFAGWILALYPGAGYWGGLPYPYALIFPCSLLLTCGLLYLGEAKGGRLVALSLAMGLAYLGYDLAPFFLPTSLLLLFWYRRWGAALVSFGLQLLPLALWLLFLTRSLDQPLKNSNSGVYWVVFTSYFHGPPLVEWWSQVSNIGEVGLDVFFGANFIFLPALFLAVVALNPLTSRIRLLPAETALLLVTLGLFLFNNLAPAYGGTWEMHGAWIARLYQPVFPVLVLFAARWWQALPPVGPVLRRLISGTLVAAVAGNALIMFGPVLNNPWKISEAAFYRFYNHTDIHSVYEGCLRDFGRRPLGFTKPQSE